MPVIALPLRLMVLEEPGSQLGLSFFDFEPRLAQSRGGEGFFLDLSASPPVVGFHGPRAFRRRPQLPGWEEMVRTRGGESAFIAAWGISRRRNQSRCSCRLAAPDASMSCQKLIVLVRAGSDMLPRIVAGRAQANRIRGAIVFKWRGWLGIWTGLRRSSTEKSNDTDLASWDRVVCSRMCG